MNSPEQMPFLNRSEGQESVKENQKFPREIEAKIINLGDPVSFLQKIEEQGGVLSKERRLLKDIGFKRREDLEQAVDFSFSLKGISDSNRFKEMLKVLGVQIISENPDQEEMNLRVMPGAPLRTLRLRQDENKRTFTIKEKRAPLKQIDNRLELEMIIEENDFILSLLEKAGYQQSSYREKYRTSFQLGDSVIDFNEGPIAPPFAEIEAKSEEEVQAIAEKLGYRPEDIQGMSDRDYYKRHLPNLTSKELDHIAFDKSETD